ncbi:Hypothetical protein PSEBR_m1109 [Pseudomonas brassicacearum subsp. brassicacearum NFM421]|uniref:Uncharacterized protein n=1 Tax=Pseudomonas brassicacearum (strain NFM421) TaxID=994484 RepID=F2KII1_PSEBN|nr:Hypothetical protein PSEBR_m1109 [Pseudomonas brassicacearum subsp. brassicacearum NFM421]
MPAGNILEISRQKNSGRMAFDVGQLKTSQPYTKLVARGFLWEQSLLAKQAPRYLKVRVACIAGKPCSHSKRPPLHKGCVWHRFLADWQFPIPRRDQPVCRSPDPLRCLFDPPLWLY